MMMTARSFTATLLLAGGIALLPAAGSLARAQSAPMPAAADRMSPVGQDREAAIDAIQAKLNSIGTMHGAFVQTGPNGEHSEGRVYIQRPGKMRFEYDEPNPMLIISDGRRVAVEDRKAKTTDQYPLRMTPLGLMLGENINLRQEANILSITVDPERVTIFMEDKDRKVPGQLTLVFAAGSYDLLQWSVRDAQGLVTSVALYDLVEGQKVSANLFYINENIFPEGR